MSQDLQDIHDVGQVIIRYATSVDKRDFDRYGSCFTEDAEISGFSSGDVVGRDNWVSFVVKALEAFRGTHHQITNQEISVDGDTAHMRSYVQATHESADDDSSLIILWAVYDDELVRTSQGWQISRHVLERLIRSKRVPTLPL
ncbi:MAG: nuclear transport factor 2 family protein [Acidimicrobiales bacterium]